MSQRAESLRSHAPKRSLFSTHLETGVPLNGTGVMSRDPLARIFQVLSHIAAMDGGATSIRAMARELQLPTTTVYRSLSALRDAGYVEYDAVRECYCLGSSAHRLARIITGRRPLPDIVIPYLQELTGATGETSFVAMYEESRLELMFIAEVQANHGLRYVVPLHTWLPLYLGASGLVILAYLPLPKQEEVLKKAQSMGQDVAALTTLMSRAREQACLTTHGHRMPGLVGTAAPIFDRDGSVIGDVIVSIPKDRYSSEREAAIEGSVRLTASKIMNVLGVPQSTGRRSEIGA